jgi:hypothetical protein
VRPVVARHRAGGGRGLSIGLAIDGRAFFFLRFVYFFFR